MAQKAEEFSDITLLLQCREGSETAFNILFRRYFTKLYNYTVSLTKDSVIAEELVMDVMLNLWLKKGNIQIQNQLGPYLFRAMKNTLINHWRKKVLYTTSLEVTKGFDYADPQAADHGIISRELQNNYQQQLNSLSPQRKKVFELSRNQDMSHKEIANELNLSIKTVENHIGAVLAFLRRNMRSLSDSTLVTLLLLLLNNQ